MLKMLTQYNVRPILLARLSSGLVTWQMEYILSRLELWLSWCKLRGWGKRVSERGPGQYFGELGLLTEQPRQATVIAKDEVKLAFLDRLSFERLVGPYMDVFIKDFKRIPPPNVTISFSS